MNVNKHVSQTCVPTWKTETCSGCHFSLHMAPSNYKSDGDLSSLKATVLPCVPPVCVCVWLLLQNTCRWRQMAEAMSWERTIRFMVTSPGNTTRVRWNSSTMFSLSKYFGGWTVATAWLSHSALVLMSAGNSAVYSEHLQCFYLVTVCFQ